MRNKLLLSLLCILSSSFLLACTDGEEASPSDPVVDPTLAPALSPADDAPQLASVAPSAGAPDGLAAAQVAPLADPVHYTCGWALPGYGCDNGRAHGEVYASDMTNAISLCRASQPSNLPDFCYVLDAQGGTSLDAAQCAAAGGSWRANNSCCNFRGTLSCHNSPAQYRCGYALPGYGCDNGRGSIIITAANLTSAVSACRASQPSNLPDFCYVRNINAGAASDPSQCAMAGGSWRPASNCCNYRGSVSCP